MSAAPTPPPTPPSAPPPTPSPTPPPVTSSEEYFNSSRLKVIGLITAATVAVGALGGIAGVAFDPEPVSKDHVHQPGGDGGTRLAPQSLGGPGSSAPHAHGPAAPFLVKVPSSDGTQTPGPVGTISPSSGLTDASSGSAAPTPLPTEVGGSTTPDGNTGTIEATGVDVYVPSGWSIDNQNDNQIYLSNGEGSYAFAFSGVEDPSTTAGDTITSALDDLLPPDLYTQRQTSDVQALDPFGSVVSIAALEYEALWVDNQGSETIHGQLYVAVRQDGTVLGIEIERMPADQFEDAVEEMYPILDNSFGRFAGLS